MLWSKPPVASTTPRRAVTVTSRPACPTTAPVTRVTVAEQAKQGGFGPHRDAGTQDTGEQPGRQGLPARGIAASQRQTAHRLGDPLGERGYALARHPGDQIHPAIVGTGDRYGEAGVQHARSQPGAVSAEHRDVQRAALAGAARGAAARLLRVIVGVVPGPEQPQRRRPAQQFDGRRHLRDERGRSSPGRRSRDDRVQVGARALGGVVGARLLEHRRGRQPQRAAGPGRRPAHERRLLHDQHRQSQLVCGQRRGHTGSGADHQQVNGGIGHVQFGGNGGAVRAHGENGRPPPRGWPSYSRRGGRRS